MKDERTLFNHCGLLDAFNGIVAIILLYVLIVYNWRHSQKKVNG